MEFFNSAAGRNITYVRPAHFTIGGLVGIPNIQYYYVCLVIIYVVSMVGNTFVMALIVWDHSLRNPKYVVVFNLVLSDVLLSTTLVPKLLDTFLFDRHDISYSSCLTYMFFMFVFTSMQSLNLVLLAFDRLVAIMFPLQYPVRITHRAMRRLVLLMWLLSATLTLTAVGFITRLSICRSVVIRSYFCDHGPVYRLACNDYTPSRVIANVCSALILWIPLVFILITYCFIARALIKISTLRERVKGLKTCSAHLTLVSIYYLPVIFIYRFAPVTHPNIRIINLSLTSILPPMLNPIIYVLQTQEIQVTLKRLRRVGGRRPLQVTVTPEQKATPAAPWILGILSPD
ncbi:olfactory receptor 1500-like [Synchiropus splendidus]|uniref:olfactory receptor 1500-like n=1 Tax=Synchiropus splendidus TaxID=270530 RepID=UPI00237E834E|nr:olfactory receptor 1500-like [Synchiropus splendidus]